MIRKLTLLTLVAAAGFAVACAGTMAKEAAESAGQDDAVMVPMFEVDPLWPKNLPNHWLMGPTIGVDVDSRDNIWVVHRNTPDNFQGGTEIGMDLRPADQRVLPARPARARVRPGRQPARQLGRPRHGDRRLRLAGVEPRHHRRPHGQRLDRRQRRRRRPRAEVHAQRRVPAAGRAATTRASPARTPRATASSSATATPPTATAASPRSASTPRPTRPTSPTATTTSASRWSTRTPAS